MRKTHKFFAFIFYTIACKEVTTASFFLIHEPTIPKELRNKNL
ncbi:MULTISPECIES: cyclic lactone autoinducer peptide [Priestia]|nr:cyclic lactone autoinducer peptide [Priestia megaterium]